VTVSIPARPAVRTAVRPSPSCPANVNCQRLRLSRGHRYSPLQRGAWAVGPIALADVLKTPLPELYNSYKEARHIIETLYLMAVVDQTRGIFL